MRRIATFLAVLLISSSALAQTPISDTKTENSQSHHGLGDAVLSTIGVATGFFVGNLLVGRSMSNRYYGGIGQEAIGYGGPRSFTPGFGIARILIVAGSGVLGAYIAQKFE